jgi:tricorn protease
MKPDGSGAKVIVNDPQIFDYDWSPDDKWIVYARMDGYFASDVFIVPSTGGAARNVTKHATWNGDVSWSATGHKIGFISQRRRQQTMCVLSLQRPAVKDAPPVADFDWDDIHQRVEFSAGIPAEEGHISPDGTRVAFRSSGTSGDDLWVASSNGSQLTRITNGNQHPTQIRWSKKTTDLIWFRDGGGSLRTARAYGGEPGRVPFAVKMIIRRDEEFSEMFEQSWRALSEQFYDPKFHGADWAAVREKYRPLVKHIATKEDLYALVSLMMGELNASHLGISGFGTRPDETTAELGLIFDEGYTGPGLKVREIVKRGPADKRGIGIRDGDIILALDGVDITEKTDVSKLLNDKANETIVAQVTSDPKADPRDPKARRRVELQTISRERMQSLMYERWVDNNAKRVAELSKGTLGYIHIPSMDEAGLDRFVQALYSDNYDKEAIVLDVRFNGGGFTHDQVLNYLGAKEHTFFRHRTGIQGSVIRSYDRKWTKPLVLLINNRSFSDAEIFPNAFRTLGLGKLVGQPTGGYVIGTSAVRLIDGSSFRVPRIGVYTSKGVNMDKEGVVPDVTVEPHPDQLARGMDPQLDAAIGVLLKDVEEWKKKKPAVVLRPGEEAPNATPVAPVGK